ncbi:MAG TPA: LacI family DNA-binding transcriptional regulator, partial [Microlunatus sp.]|nr:LacI family DNA-binding transcriptional regulator [Microlunatus sp.]
MSASRAGRPATIADVAARAGVSPATVSRVMNGTRAVDEEMTERVRSAVLELDYSPSPLARSLVLGRTNTVAVVVPDLGNPTFHGVLRGLSHAASRNGFHVLVADSAESVDDELVLAEQTRRRCDGLVLVAPRMAEADLDRLLRTLQPVVVVNREPTVGSGTPVVTADYRFGLSGLLDLLYADGHRSLMFLAGAPQSASNARRLAALDSFLTSP